MEQQMPDRSGQVTIDGKDTYFEFFGRGDRETVCLLNGLAMSTQSWYGFVPLLSDAYDVLLFDYYGQGKSFSEDTPYFIPDFARSLRAILDELGIQRVHVMGISYGGFVALDFARLFQSRLHTLTLSGILLTHEVLFDMYQDLSLRFYRGDEAAFHLYTVYMYEKIFGETFVKKIPAEKLDGMRQNFFDRYVHLRHCLIRLTEAQNPFFGALDEKLPQYRAIRTPTLVLAGAQDRAIPPWVQKKLCDILPHTRYEAVDDCGHVVYLEKSERFFGALKRFMNAKVLDFGPV